MVKPSSYSEAGNPIYKYEDKEREWTPPEYGEEGWSEKIEAHVEKYVGPIDHVFHEILSDLVHIDVYHIKPTEARNFHTLFTTGMSYKPMNVPEGQEDYRYAELMMCLPPEWPISSEAFQEQENYWPIQWLKMLARFPHDFQTWLGDGHTMPNGDPANPLSGQTEMNGIILLRPITVHPDFLTLPMDEERTVRFYCIVPLYGEEMEFKLKYGYSKLTDKFDEHGMNEVFQPNRKKVCKKSRFSFWKK
ncbi:suppressor of fused domain protein [Paenibacillus sp. y28]|uniref:suppressor of fused domain protein n=1 Tax=Paenibacillus sp. y28 TaxID=3129110 RepID=UPI00301A1A45